MTEVVFISDFFADEIQGGAELCNAALIGLLQKRYKVEKIKSVDVTPEAILDNLDSFFIIANFFLLPEPLKKIFIDKTKYVILEHDHKYVKSNNPSLYKDFLAPEAQIINKDFYANALAVMCQSKKHASVVQKNLLLNNIISLSGNIWTEEQLKVIENNLDTTKTIKFAILNSTNKNKGMPAAIDFCNKNNLPYELIHPQSFESFIANLAQVEHLVFFPQWLETYNRLSIEARILGCKLVTNNLIGAASEDYFKLKGRELLEFIRGNNTTLMNKWFNLIDEKEVEYYDNIELPKVTILGTFYDGSEYIEGFLENITTQTIFDRCELILIDANSPGNEKEIIDQYVKKHDNIIYKRLDYRATTGEAFNMGIEMSTGEFLTFGLIDDRRHATGLEILTKHLMFSPEVDLVYGDCFETDKPNETYEKNSSNGKLYEHSLKSFSKENMIKCLPGPMPLWRKTMNEKHGAFNTDIDFADDWEMWLRAVNGGSKFKKINIIIGLYLSGGRSQSDKLNVKQNLEESELFFKYAHLFGNNFHLFKDYFTQLKGLENVQ